ncbi:MAG: hypothetical protein ABIQ01_02200 [Pseudolysinimonas sp.]
MADPLLVHSDLETFLVDWYRTKLAALATAGETSVAGFEVDRVEPSDDSPFPEWLLVIRDDSGPAELLTAERALGFSVLGGNQLDPSRAKRACAIVLGLLWTIPAPDGGEVPRNPITSVEGTNGPYLVAEEQDRARAYGTGTVTVTPEAL